MSNHRVGGNETRKAETLDREREIVRLLKEGVGRTEVAAMLGYKNAPTRAGRPRRGQDPPLTSLSLWLMRIVAGETNGFR
jgi:hypothetical protein